MKLVLFLKFASVVFAFLFVYQNDDVCYFVMKDNIQRRPHDWKMHMNESLREVDRKDLANLNAMVNYQRNPRHIPPSAPPGGRTLVKSNKPKPKEFGIQSKPETPK